MGLWKRGRYGVPVRVVDDFAPVDLVDTPEGALVEARARNAEAAAIVDATLARHRGEGGNTELINVLLDIRSALRPAPPGSQVPLVRRAAPALPRRSS